MKRVFLQVACLLTILLLLCACSASQEPATEPPVCYTVVYMVGDSLYTSQTVELGHFPQPVEVQLAGLEITGWLDEKGAAVEPERMPVIKDACYTVQATPKLVRHMPYLQLDENNFLNPDAPMNDAALRFALQALCEEAAYPFLPELPQTQQLTAQQLKAVLRSFFEEDVIASAVTAADTEIVTRAQFAGYMHTLLGREETETFILGAGAVLPEDITAQHADAQILLEACMRHTPDPEGSCWQDMELPAGWEPGLHMENGWLYYVQPDGRLLRNSDLGKLHFGADGRYTSGDPELDVLVAETLNTIITENPELEGLDLLRKVFDHCYQDYKYLRKDAYDFGATGWEVADAKEMLQKGRGNCYNFAAIFWALAQGMGYDVQCLAGTCTGTDQPHGWVVLKYEDVYYFVDPEWQYAYTEREIYDKDMFMLTMDEVWWWTYRWDNTQFAG